MSLTISEDDSERGAKKKQIINAWLLDNDISPTDLDKVLNSSYEYIRREIKKLKDGEISQESIEAAADENLQAQLREELENNGIEVMEGAADAESVNTTAIREASDRSDYQGTLEDATKKSRILNSVLLSNSLDADIHYSEMAAAANCSNEYARRLAKNVRDGEITDEDLQDAADEDLQQALTQFYEDNNILGTTDDESKVQADSVNIDLSNEEDPFKNVDVSKREALVNIFLFDAELSKADAGDLAGASSEYARQTFNGIQSGRYNPEEYLNEAIQNTLEQLDESGELGEFFSGEERRADESKPEGKAEFTEGKAMDTTSGADTSHTSSPACTQGESAMIPASELEDVRDKAELLLKQAEYEAEAGYPNAKAEFIAKEILDELNNLLETA